MVRLRRYARISGEIKDCSVQPAADQSQESHRSASVIFLQYDYGYCRYECGYTTWHGFSDTKFCKA
eukprot:scaffold566175_cov18-Prasinocladus_malaysianus.AAC.1